MNVLIVFTDQQRADLIGPDRTPDTPNLDRLAAEGVTFDNAICPQPVCTPSRGSLMTGVYPHTHGCVINCMREPGYYDMRLPESIPTIAELLKPHGYKAGYVGKWHVGNEVVPQHGFEDYWISTEDEYTRPEDRARLGNCAYYHYLVEQGYRPDGDFFVREQTAGLPEEHSRIAFITRESERFMEANRDDDFCLVVNYLEPHPPYYGPDDDRYSPDEVRIPDNYHREPVAGMSQRAQTFLRFSQEMSQSGEPPLTEDALRSVIARYHGLMTLADKYAGRLLDTLERLGLKDDTLVVFTSDHGDMMGSHGMLNKCVMYDEALRVPFIIRGPGVSMPGARVTESANLVDVVPTALDAAGDGKPRHLQGESLWPLLTGARPEDPEKPAFSEWCGVLQWMHKRHDLFAPVADCHIRTVRTPRWKLNVNPGDTWELYDLESDPGEMNNLIDEPSRQETVQELLAMLRDWQTQTGDPLGQ